MTQTDSPPATVADARPVPQPSETTRFYWDNAAQGRLTMQRCRSCRQMQFPPDVCCIHCQSESFDIETLSGLGTVYSFTWLDRPLHVGFVDSLPYVVALVELNEQAGLRIIANILGAQPGGISCGMRVQVTFEERRDITLPQFKLAAAQATS
jgi:uncharacterized OB-fold protein